nr:MAG TPA: hypothetical protein [Caudoviricetes sp.]
MQHRFLGINKLLPLVIYTLFLILYLVKVKIILIMTL